MTFGEKLKKARLKAGYSQTKLAKAIGVALNTIYNYENGLTLPQNYEIYEKLGEVLNLDPLYLYNEEKETLTGPQKVDALLSNVTTLFAGGELSEDEVDGVMKALQEIYWKCREDSKKKASKKYLS